MPALGLPTGTQERSYGGLPQLPIVNLVSEKAITEPTQFTLQSRPKLQRYLSSAWGSADPIQALFYTDNSSLGNFFSVFAGLFYNNFDVSSTALAGSLAPSIAGNEIGVVATAGGTAKWWDGSTYRSISFPDGASVTKVLETQGRFVFIRASSQRYYWTEPLSNMLDGSGDIVVDGLAFASAENRPDWLVDALVWQDRLVLGGNRTVEIHGPSGDDNAPWNPILGSTIHKGVLRTGAMAIFDSTFAWVSPEKAIWKYNDSSQPDKISNAGIEEALKFGDSIRLDSFFLEGREFLHVWDEGGGFTLLDGDLLLDASTGEWCEWETNGSAFDGGPSVAATQSYPLFGGKSDSILLGISSRSILPGGSWETTVEHRFRAGLPIEGGGIDIENLLVRCQTYDGSGSQALSMRFSTDKGQNWTDWFDISLVGLSQRVGWDSLGRMFQPGFMVEFKTANCIEFSVSGVSYNEFVEGV